MSDLVERLREEALEADKEAWRRLDGGHEYTMGAMLADEAADRIEALEAEIERLREALAFYANGEWSDGYPGGVKHEPNGDGVTHLDFGDRAKAALANLEAPQ